MNCEENHYALRTLERDDRSSYFLVTIDESSGTSRLRASRCVYQRARLITCKNKLCRGYAPGVMRDRKSVVIARREKAVEDTRQGGLAWRGAEK